MIMCSSKIAKETLRKFKQGEWESLVRFTDKGCWEWTGNICKDGYGLIGMARAHRVSYVTFKGDFPNSSLICHKCDNRRCVNPDHLYEGDEKTNAMDASMRNRIVSPPSIYKRGL